MLERMSDFFENRIDGYDEHMLRDIELADEFYPYTASCLPCIPKCRVLDLGCGTGIELEFYFKLNPTSKIVGIDLSDAMLSRLKEKFPERDVTVIRGSYFDLPLGEAVYDAAVSVESLHHFTKDEKTALYKKLHNALRDGGCFILTDYFSMNDEEEMRHRQNLAALKKEQGIIDNDLHHYDTPLTVAHETEALLDAGFSSVEVLKCWGATYTIKVIK